VIGDVLSLEIEVTFTTEWTITKGDCSKTFIAHHIDEPSDRTDAIAYFRSNDCGVYSICPITDEIWAMPEEAANCFLSRNPTPQQIGSLYIRSRTRTFTDSDLSLLLLLPELRNLNILSRAVTDAGIQNIEHLGLLESLVVYSPLVTDTCLQSIAKLKQLKSLDLQGSPNILNARRLRKHLPKLDEYWGPQQECDRTNRSTEVADRTFPDG
jgi:hypothetical protein